MKTKSENLISNEKKITQTCSRPVLEISSKQTTVYANGFNRLCVRLI